MKKIKFIVLILIMMFTMIPNVFAAEKVVIESVTLDSKTDNVIELSHPTINGMNIGFDLSFVNIEDFAKYKVILNNKSNKDFYIDNKTNFSNSEYLSYEYEFQDKNTSSIKANSKVTMFITIKYKNKVPIEKLVNGIYTEENAMAVDLSDIILTNPKTYTNILSVALLFILLIGVIIMRLHKKKGIKLPLFLLGLLLLPLTTYALEKITIKVQTKVTVEENRNIIEARYVDNIPGERDFWQYYKYIKTVTFETKIEEPTNYEEKFDVSNEKNNSIIAYVIKNQEDETLYDVIIMSNGYIYANPDSSCVFQDMIKLTTINNLENYKTIYAENMISMFSYISSMEELDLSGFDTSNVTNMEEMFCQFYYGNLLKSINVSSFDTSNVTDMGSMFSGCRNVETLDLSSFDTSNVTNMDSMFANCYKLKNLNISSFNTQKVVNMYGMFSYCSIIKSLDLSNFDTSNVTAMTRMFSNLQNIENIYVGEKWNTNNVTQSYRMFNGCEKLRNYNSEIIDKTNANTSETGYLTFKGE